MTDLETRAQEAKIAKDEAKAGETVSKTAQQNQGTPAALAAQPDVYGGMPSL
jgi:hypothetical protein